MTTIRVSLAAPSETRLLGAAVAEVAEGGDVILLVGELGAGKTTFTKGLVAALGAADVVTSPTFTLLHCYPSVPPVAHVDCWRLSDLSEVAELGLEEILDDGGVAVVEWGELVAPLLGRQSLTISFELVESGAAEIGPVDTRPVETGPVESASRRVGFRCRALLEVTGSGWARRFRHLEMACRNAGLATELLGAARDERAATR